MTSEATRRDQDDSGEYSDASQDIEHNNSLNAGQHESDYDSQGSESETSDRDPDSQETSERRVDDDEDRSNPQYIPKRGTFYEHDDRTAASGEESSNTTSEAASEKKDGTETPSDRRRPPRKSETVNKWSHDKYIENEQVPKSREELVAIYGYDIRNEDAPPHARRNRRYGRGPNKYTRTWEDEEAYRRQNANQPRKPPNPEDFPELDAANKQGTRKPRMTRPRSKSQPASNESSEAGAVPGGGAMGAGGVGGVGGAEGVGLGLRRNASIKARARPKPKPAPKVNRSDNKLPALENLTITTNVNNSQGQPQRKVNATVAQQRPVPTDQARRKPMQTQQQPSPAPNKTPPQQQNAQQKPNNQQHQQQNAGAESRGGSKRYSSMRQRPLGDSYTPQPQPQPPTQQQQPQPAQAPQQQQQQQHRYHNGPGEYTGAAPPHQGSPVAHPPHLMHQVHRAASPPHAPLPHPQPHAPPITQPPITQQQQVRLGMLEQQQLVQHQHHSMHNIPQQHAIGQLQPSQGYAPPAMMPTQYMQPGVPPSGSGAVFGAAPMYAQPPPAPYQHQIYPHHNFVPQQAGGVTYYSCEQQDQLPRPQRRPTAAIPIVRPQAPDRAANSTEKDNIDRIVENMFVRKPWPATHGSDKEKSSDNRSSQEPQSKESSQPNSLTSSSISTDSKPSEKTDKDEKADKDEKTEDEKKPKEPDATQQECTSDA